MADCLNRVTLIGYVGRDPDVRELNNGNLMARFTLATRDFWRDKNTGELRDQVEWHRVVSWHPRISAQIAREVKRGSKVLIEGSVHTHKWMGNDGIERDTTDIEIRGFTGRLCVMEDHRNSVQSLDEPEEAAGPPDEGDPA